MNGYSPEKTGIKLVTFAVLSKIFGDGVQVIRLVASQMRHSPNLFGPSHVRGNAVECRVFIMP